MPQKGLVLLSDSGNTRKLIWCWNIRKYGGSREEAGPDALRLLWLREDCRGAREVGDREEEKM